MGGDWKDRSDQEGKLLNNLKRTINLYMKWLLPFYQGNLHYLKFWVMRNCYTLETKIVELFLILRVVFSFYTVVALQFKDEDCLSKVFTLVISHSKSNLFKVFIIYFTKLLLLWSRLSFFHPLCLWFVVLQELLCYPPPCVTKPLQYFIN